LKKKKKKKRKITEKKEQRVRRLFLGIVEDEVEVLVVAGKQTSSSPDRTA
jgi:hypothetical protein